MTATRSFRNCIAGRGIVVAWMCVLAGCASGGGASGQANAPLANTYWTLVEAGGKPVAAALGQREPAHFILRTSDKPTLAGSDGCNRMTGSYRVDGDAIEFGPMAATRMACATGMDVERAFHAALGAARRWSIRGPVLELRDGGGKAVARFEARTAN